MCAISRRKKRKGTEAPRGREPTTKAEPVHCIAIILEVPCIKSECVDAGRGMVKSGGGLTICCKTKRRHARVLRALSLLRVKTQEHGSSEHHAIFLRLKSKYILCWTYHNKYFELVFASRMSYPCSEPIDPKLELNLEKQTWKFFDDLHRFNLVSRRSKQM